MNKLFEVSIMVLLEVIVATIIFMVYNYTTDKNNENPIVFFILNYTFTIILFLFYHFVLGIKLYGDFIKL